MDSIWEKTALAKPRKPLRKNIRTEIAIIGAGMTGILLADRLMAEGRDIVVLEAAEIGSGQTAGTTAKITAQHGLFYQHLLQQSGHRMAALYAQGQREAIAAYRRLIKDREIDCDWQECRSYLYTFSDTAALKREEKAAKALGFDAGYTEKTALPKAVRGAVFFEKQAMFHPLSFLYALAADLPVYEHTPVARVENNRLVTENAIVTADYIVFACHFPFVNFPGQFFTRMHQERSFVLALSGISNPPQDLYYGIDKTGYSLRPYRDLVLFGGEGRRTGTGTGGSYDRLEAAAKAWFPEAAVTARWSAQDCMPARGFPYIGRFSQKHLNWFVATGYRKWGMTSSMVAATMLCDMLCNRESSLEEVFSPDEFSAHELPQILEDSCRSAGALLSHALPVQKKAPESISAQAAATTGQCRAAYRDSKRELHHVSLRCPHLGCRLHFDADEKTWECPCHGSRFDHRGRCIGGPAQKNISM